MNRLFLLQYVSNFNPNIKLALSIPAQTPEIAAQLANQARKVLKGDNSDWTLHDLRDGTEVNLNR